MKIAMGPYKSWIGPYQIAEKILFWQDKYESDYIDKLGDFLAHGFSKDKDHMTWLYRFCVWFESKRKRKIKVRIDNYDTWGADHTMALIILPLLKKIKENKNGSPMVDDEDVPEELRSNVLPPVEEYGTDGNWHKRWEYVLDEMIWSFEQLANDEWEDQFHKDGKFDRDGWKAHDEKIIKGTILFGKYYTGLWT